MALTPITESTAAEFIANHELVLLEFEASRCPTCRALAPVLEAASERHPDVGFGRIDSDREKDLRHAFGIEALPTVVIVREQVLLLTHKGFLDAKAIDRVLEDARAADIEAIREAERSSP